MIQSFYTGNGGLNANKFWLSVISDNIANVNTVGFKAERANFEDLIAKSITTFTNGSPKNLEIGGGAFVGSTVKDFSQGTFMNTNNSTDVALDGEGFFMLKGADTTYYTRNGQFRLDANGDIININGMKVQGWMLDDYGNISGSISDLRVPTAIDPKATANISFENPTNLNVDSEMITDILDTGDSKTFNYVNSVEVFDSLGVSHQVEYYFVHKDSNKWNVFSLIDDRAVQYDDGSGNKFSSLEVEFNSNGSVNSVSFAGQITNNTGTTATEDADTGAFNISGSPSSIMPGTIKISDFKGTPVHWIDDGHGNIVDLDADQKVVGSISYDDGKINIFAAAGDTSASSTLTMDFNTYDLTQKATVSDYTAIKTDSIPLNNPDSAKLNTGANPLSLTFNVENIKQLSSDFIFFAKQDGNSKGDLLGISVSEDGVIKGNYSNGTVKDLARLAVATFKDKEMLVNKGGFLYMPNSQTFTPVIIPGGVISKIRSGMLEMSNVDISQEFINLITAQRAYQANARTITTSDQVLQETMNIKR